MREGRRGKAAGAEAAAGVVFGFSRTLPLLSSPAVNVQSRRTLPFVPLCVATSRFVQPASRRARFSLLPSPLSRVRLGVLVVLLLACASRAMPAAGTSVSGTVSGTDQGFLTGASVAIEGSLHREAKTDADGRFTFTDMPRGRYRIVVSFEGYLPLDQPLDVGDASVSVDIVLLRIPSLP